MRTFVNVMAVAYLPVALLAGGAIIVGGTALHAPALPLVVLGALAAYLAERTAPRAVDPRATSAGAAVYAGLALLWPAPWVVLVAVSAAAATALTSGRVRWSKRCASAAHVVMGATVFSLLVRWARGTGNLPSTVADLFGGPARHGTAATAALLPLSTVCGLGVLALAYYLLDTTPLVLMAALLDRANPIRVWRTRYRSSTAAACGLLGLGLAAAAVPAGARPLALLTLPAGLALGMALVRAWQQVRDAEAAEKAAVQQSRVPVAGISGAEQMTAALAAVRVMSGTDSVDDVLASLAQAACRVTTFRSCIVYLYDAQEGVFVPRASAGTRILAWEGVPRDTVAGLMAPDNLVGYSYHVRGVARSIADPAGWGIADSLVTPLQLQNGDVIGYLCLETPRDTRPPCENDLAALETVVALAARMIARLRHTDSVLHLATTDGLTGLLNRRTFDTVLQEEMATVAGRARPLSLLMVDIDDFATINNTYGHQTGDAALRLVADVIRTHLRPTDTGVRYGGDELAVLLPGLDATRAASIAERVRTTVAEATRQAVVEGRLPQISTSIGVASYPDDALDGEGLIKAADEALYDSKRQGKNRVSIRSVA